MQRTTTIWVGIIFSGLLVLALLPKSETTRFDMPIVLAGESADEEQKEETKTAMAGGGDLTGTTPWLHVVVETKYAWIYQKSTGRAWTTVSRDDTTRVNVGELCLELNAYGKHKVCEADTSFLEVTDMKRRVAVKKRKAVVSAWAESPKIAKTTVEMEP